MANETKTTTAKTNADGTPKKTRAKVTKKSEWTVNGKVATRTVNSVYGPDKKPITYTEYKLHKVSDPTEAMQLLKLKSSRAVAAFVKGFNTLNRASAAGDTSLIQKIAERKGISYEEAAKLL